jgi:hypothetical protein
VANVLYLARPMTSGIAVLSFYQSQFTGGSMDQAPSGVALADTATSLADLRIIAHARVKDWLAGADLESGSSTATTTGTGTNVLHLWKGPSQGGTSTPFTLASAVQVRGLAMDGSQ